MTATITYNDSPELFFSHVNEIIAGKQWVWPNWLAGNVHNNYIRIQERGDVENKSFIFLWNNNPLIVFFGFVSSDKNVVDVPGCYYKKDEYIAPKVFKQFLHEFESQVLSAKKHLWIRDFMHNGSISRLTKIMLEKGARSEHVFSNVLDLSKEKEEIHKNIRASYKSLINWGSRELRPRVFTQDNIDWNIVNEFRLLHIHEAGKEVRSEMTWRKQMDMVSHFEAFIVCGYSNNEMVSAGLFSFNGTNCDYQVSASKRELFDKPLFHSLMWSAMLHAKIIGCKWFEFGDLSFLHHPSDQLPTKKELGISNFKSGFGGNTKLFLDVRI